MKQIIRLTESDLHRLVKESVKKILKENFWDNFSPDALDDKAYMDDFWKQREQNSQEYWQAKMRELRQQYPGKSQEWYEAMIDTM